MVLPWTSKSAKNILTRIFPTKEEESWQGTCATLISWFAYAFRQNSIQNTMSFQEQKSIKIWIAY
jgi:hypothetical protein